MTPAKGVPETPNHGEEALGSHIADAVRQAANPTVLIGQRVSLAHRGAQP